MKKATIIILSLLIASQSVSAGVRFNSTTYTFTNTPGQKFNSSTYSFTNTPGTINLSFVFPTSDNQTYVSPDTVIINTSDSGYNRSFYDVCILEIDGVNVTFSYVERCQYAWLSQPVGTHPFRMYLNSTFGGDYGQTEQKYFIVSEGGVVDAGEQENLLSRIYQVLQRLVLAEGKKLYEIQCDNNTDFSSPEIDRYVTKNHLKLDNTEIPTGDIMVCRARIGNPDEGYGFWGDTLQANVSLISRT